MIIVVSKPVEKDIAASNLYKALITSGLCVESSVKDKYTDKAYLTINLIPEHMGIVRGFAKRGSDNKKQIYILADTTREDIACLDLGNGAYLTLVPTEKISTLIKETQNAVEIAAQIYNQIKFAIPEIQTESELKTDSHLPQI